MSLKMIAAAALVAASTAGIAAAQDWSLNPTFGTVNLTTGFTPDPYTVPITAGGTIDATQVFDRCRGMIANAPDYRLHFNAGSLPLSFGSQSNRDTTLVINAPDGSWYCDDDGGEGLNAHVTFNNPQSGQYDIWIGTYGTNSDLAQATLTISELGY